MCPIHMLRLFLPLSHSASSYRLLPTNSLSPCFFATLYNVAYNWIWHKYAFLPMLLFAKQSTALWYPIEASQYLTLAMTCPCDSNTNGDFFNHWNIGSLVQCLHCIERDILEIISHFGKAVLIKMITSGYCSHDIDKTCSYLSSFKFIEFHFF